MNIDNNLFQINISAIVKNHLGETLIVKRSINEDIYPGLWGIPGGKMDAQDQSLEDAVKREVKEETGIQVEFIRLLQNNSVIKKNLNKLYLVVLVEYISGEAEPLEDTEVVKWVSKNDLANFEFTPFTYEILLSAFKE